MKSTGAVSVLALVSTIFFALSSSLAENPKLKVYVAPSDHTDYIWTSDEPGYRAAFIRMLDAHLALADQTAALPTNQQARFNTDGTLWLWEYEHNKSQPEFERLINRVKDGHIGVPINPLVLGTGGMPVEAVIRSMLYAGDLERRYNLRFPIATAAENHTLPYGIGSLWAGSGVKYAWHGVNGLFTGLPLEQLANREHEIYWMTGPDGSRVLMKWYSLYSQHALGSYAEAATPRGAISFVAGAPEFRQRFPYDLVGIFGMGWDTLETLNNPIAGTEGLSVQFASQGVQVTTSNGIDFFEAFEKAYGKKLPSVGESFGNEWELANASISELSGSVKRSIEKLRSAEALAAILKTHAPSLLSQDRAEHELAMYNLGLFFEHDWIGNGPLPPEFRIAWQKKTGAIINSYVDRYLKAALAGLTMAIGGKGEYPRFFVFNPLSWERTDFADLPYSSNRPVSVIDLSTAKEMPSQRYANDGASFIRVLASKIPSVGYKVFEIRPSENPSSLKAAATFSDRVFESSRYRVKFAANGAIDGLYDKQLKSEFGAQIGGRTLNDLGGSDQAALSVENPGPVSATLRIKAQSPLKHGSTVTLFSALDRIDIQDTIEQNFEATQSWDFGFNLKSPTVVSEEVGAVFPYKLINAGGRFATRNARLDWLTINHFADISEGNGRAVTLSNADAYFMQIGNSSIGEVDTKTPQLKILAGGRVLGPYLGLKDQGGLDHFENNFALRTRQGAFNQRAAMQFALEHQNPLLAGEISGEGSLPEKSYSFMQLSNPDILVWALKPAESGVDGDLVLRVWNQQKNPQNFTAKFAGAKVTEAKLVTHIETSTGKAEVSSGTLDGRVNPQQIKSFAVRLAK
ncbi:MAG: glycoside hydrolase [Oligoflexia bacterium]|nr:glycoside hydrolase [Oligoflexia bacterium]